MVEPMADAEVFHGFGVVSIPVAAVAVDAPRDDYDLAMDTKHELIDALGDIQEAAEANISRNREITRRARWLRERLSAEDPLHATVESEPRPLIVEMVTDNIASMQEMGLRLRRAQVRALRDEGLTMTEIAELYGVTRQRISALMRERSTGD